MEANKRQSIASLKTNYESDIALANERLAVSAENIKKTNMKLQDAIREAKNIAMKMGEHAQVDEAILLSLFSGFGKDIKETILELRKMMQELQSKGLSEQSAVVRGRLDRIIALGDKINAYNKYHKDLLPLQKELELQARELKEGKNTIESQIAKLESKSDTLTLEEKKELEQLKKELASSDKSLSENAKEYAKVISDIDDVCELYGTNSEEELTSVFETAEKQIFGENENPILSLRENTSAMVEEMGSQEASKRIAEIGKDAFEEIGLNSSVVAKAIETPASHSSSIV
jgi:hypothetical protein